MNPLTQQVQELQRQVDELSKVVQFFVRTTDYRFLRPIKGGTDGLRIATATTDKLSFYGKTPIVQPSSHGVTNSMTTVGGTAVTESNGFDGLLGGTFFTIGDIVKHLKTLGILAA